jgi:hypothetical protein
MRRAHTTSVNKSEGKTRADGRLSEQDTDELCADVNWVTDLTTGFLKRGNDEPSGSLTQLESSKCGNVGHDHVPGVVFHGYVQPKAGPHGSTAFSVHMHSRWPDIWKEKFDTVAPSHGVT